MYARVAVFEGGDPALLERINEKVMAEAGATPAGVVRLLVLEGDDGRLVMTFFGTREELDAAEAAFERMGDEISEAARGRRTSVAVYEVALDWTA